MPSYIDTFFVDTNVNVNSTVPASSSTVLVSGQVYTITVDGNFSWWINSVVPFGDPDDIIYLSPNQAERPASMDAETIYADIQDRPLPRHVDTDPRLIMDLGSGFSHRHPDGGQLSTPSPDHSYEYTLTGEGSVLRASITNATAGTPNGKLRFRIHQTGRPFVGVIGVG